MASAEFASLFVVAATLLLIRPGHCARRGSRCSPDMVPLPLPVDASPGR
jgi:hypothetical protein